MISCFFFLQTVQIKCKQTYKHKHRCIVTSYGAWLLEDCRRVQYK